MGLDAFGIRVSPLAKALLDIFGQKKHGAADYG